MAPPPPTTHTFLHVRYKHFALRGEILLYIHWYLNVRRERAKRKFREEKRSPFKNIIFTLWLRGINMIWETGSMELRFPWAFQHRGFHAYTGVSPRNRENRHPEQKYPRKRFAFLKNFLLKYSWITMLCWLLLYSKVTQLHTHTHAHAHTHIHIFLFGFILIGHHNFLTILGKYFQKNGASVCIFQDIYFFFMFFLNHCSQKGCVCSTWRF